MPHDLPFDAALLAGGRSTRFESDKAFLLWKGRPLYVEQLRKLAALKPEKLWLSTNADQPFPQVLEGVSRRGGEAADLGPPGGRKTNFAKIRAESVLLLAVGRPHKEAGFLKSLLASGRGTGPK
jgi:molybdopterin-guanine dinucleotide biosynthesis protein A